MMGGFLERMVESGRAPVRELRGHASGAEETDLEAPEPEQVVTPRAPSLLREPPTGESARGTASPEARHPVPVLRTVSPDAEAVAAPNRQLLPRVTPPPQAPHGATRPRALSLRDAGIRDTDHRLLRADHTEVTRPGAPARATAESREGEQVAAPGVSDRRENQLNPMAGVRASRTPPLVMPQGPGPVVIGAALNDDVIDTPSPSAVLDSELSPARTIVPAARLEQWERLRERLLVAHPPPFPPAVVIAPGNEPVRSSPETRAQPSEREIVIRELEVIVAAPSPVPAAPVQAPVAHPPSTPRSGAWTVAGRHYLGKL